MSSREKGRRVKVEVRGLPEVRHMLMYISERMNKVRDLGIKLKYVCEDINQTYEIKIYRDKFLLPDNENINIIETGEEIIVYINAIKTEYVESKEDKNALVNVREEVLKENEKKLEIKEIELKSRETSLKKMEDALKKREEDLKYKERNLEDKVTLVKAREEVSKEHENELEIKEMELESKEISLKNMEDTLKKTGEDLKYKERNLANLEVLLQKEFKKEGYRFG